MAVMWLNGRAGLTFTMLARREVEQLAPFNTRARIPHCCTSMLSLHWQKPVFKEYQCGWRKCTVARAVVLDLVSTNICSCVVCTFLAFHPCGQPKLGMNCRVPTTTRHSLLPVL